MLGCGSNAPTLSCACFCECNSQQPRTKMGKRCAAASFRSRHTARRGYAGREQFPLLLQFFDPTTSSSPFSSVLSAWAAASVTRAWRLKRSKNRSSFGIKARNQPSMSASHELNRCRKDAARTISEFKSMADRPPVGERPEPTRAASELPMRSGLWQSRSCSAGAVDSSSCCSG